MSGNQTLSPVLLLGGGAGEATCGILYLASYLRRGGVETYVRLWDADETEAQVRRSLEALVARVRPKLVGISFKWFHHVHRVLWMARALRRIDPRIRIVVGGNSASWFWRELATIDVLDHVVLGDGERPLLALAQGDPSPPNTVGRGPDGAARRLPLAYVQGATNTEDIYYSHFGELFLSGIDQSSFSGWVAPGKGCGENCLYCGGARGNQKAAFGRAKPFLRAEESVRRDHQEIASRTWQMRYDFAGSSAAFLESTWAGVDLSRHVCTYFLWGVPKPELVESLSRAFQRVYMVVDIGCFSESQRLEQMKRGLLKPCATDRELLEVIDQSRRHANLEIEVSGIGGLPFASLKTLQEERALVEQIIERDCVIGYQRLEAQPGALVTEHPARFGMVTEARSFQEFLQYFDRRPPGDPSVPMIRFQDAKLEAAVQRTSDEIDALNWAHRSARKQVTVKPRTRLKSAVAATRSVRLGDWLGAHRVPAKHSAVEVTVIRSMDGLTLSCTPALPPKRFQDPALIQGEDAEVLLSALATFERPMGVADAAARLTSRHRIAPEEAGGLIDHLVEERLLQPA